MVTLESVQPRHASMPYRVAEPVDSGTFHEIRRRLVLDSCKWDSQVGDVPTLSRFPLIMPASRWEELAELARQLALELMAAEAELIKRPELHAQLGLPRRLRMALQRSANTQPPAAARSLRFDFHWTDEGWRISEVNSDVPGGYCESSDLPALMAPCFRNCRPAGHPGAGWADAIASRVDPGRSVGLLCATGFMEDRQILAYLQRLLEARGLPCCWINPDLSGLATLQLGALVRFYQAEWLSHRQLNELVSLPGLCIMNPLSAALTESKRFPILWDRLHTPLPTWKALLPETREPREAPWQSDDSWLVKSALCNTGDTVAIRSLLKPADWQRVRFSLWLNPRQWIAQRRFNALPIESSAGLIYPCVGVYTIDGKVCGIYGRYSLGPVINYCAVDIPVLIEEGASASR